MHMLCIGNCNDDFIFFFFFFVRQWSGRLGFNPGSNQIQKMVHDASLFNIQHYKVRFKGKRSNPGKGVAQSSISR